MKGQTFRPRDDSGGHRTRFESFWAVRDDDMISAAVMRFERFLGPCRALEMDCADIAYRPVGRSLLRPSAVVGRLTVRWEKAVRLAEGCRYDFRDGPVFPRFSVPSRCHGPIDAFEGRRSRLQWHHAQDQGRHFRPARVIRPFVREVNASVREHPLTCKQVVAPISKWVQPSLP